MAGIHRVGDLRFCGASTLQEGNSTVFANGKLFAVERDPNSHGEGRLVSSVGSTVYAEGKLVIVAVGDTAEIDLIHTTPNITNPLESSGDVNAYGG